MSERKETYIVEEDTDVGILIDLPDGGQVWSGPISKELFDLQGEDRAAALGGDDFGLFVVDARIQGSPQIVCRAASVDDGIAVARAIARVDESRQKV